MRSVHWLDSNGNQANCRMAQSLESRVSGIDDAAATNKVFGWAAVSDGDKDATSVLVGGVQGLTNFGAERIKPGSSGELIGIKSSPVGHESATVILAIP